ncbi:helix-turn-helix domain-containing protein [Sulfobacillus sp. hq2]|uniref:helix-turn-helix domain-containing protein n=1 Tax=Sulfobacillus TaxID=28033 RepID=UPI001304EDF2|nr:helix-turn-helix transcriptional regulator [Sulfobacillus sp. hq2]
MKIGAKFRAARLALGLTQQEVSENLCDRSYVSLFERDKVSPPVELVVELAKRVKISVSKLLETADEPVRNRSQLLFTDDLVGHGQVNVALQQLEQLWWDAISGHDTALAYEIYHRVLRLINTGMTQVDVSWLTSSIMWLLGQGKNEWALHLGYQLQRILFERGQWQSAVSWGKTLMALAPPLDIRVRAGIGTASALLRQGDFYQAEQQYIDVLECIPANFKIKTQPVAAFIHHGLSAVYGRTNAWQKAYTNADLAVATYHKPSAEYWLAMQNVGIIRGQLGHRREALVILSKCEEYWIQAKDSSRVADLKQDLELL